MTAIALSLPNTSSTSTTRHTCITPPTMTSMTSNYKYHPSLREIFKGYDVDRIVHVSRRSSKPPVQLVRPISLMFVQKGNIQIYSSLFEYIWGIFKKYSENMSSTFNA
jgi:hypothetical protein